MERAAPPSAQACSRPLRSWPGPLCSSTRGGHWVPTSASPGQKQGQMDRGLPSRGKVKGFLSRKEPCVEGREMVMAKRLGCVVYLQTSKSKFWYPVPCASYTAKFCIGHPNTPLPSLLRVPSRSLWETVLPPLSVFVVWGLYAHFWPRRGARSRGRGWPRGVLASRGHSWDSCHSLWKTGSLFLLELLNWSD